MVIQTQRQIQKEGDAIKEFIFLINTLEMYNIADQWPYLEYSGPWHLLCIDKSFDD